MSAVSEKVKEMMKQMEPQFIKDLHWFHENPEMSFQEYDTTAYIKKALSDMGVEIQEFDGLETGAVGIIRGAKEGPCIGLRADIDALPVQEKSTCTYPSKRPGLMHACGHDIHQASLLSAARMLVCLKDEMAGSVKLMFQPAEELNLGARKMVNLGCTEGLDVIFGMHNSSEIPQGSVAVKRGALMAAVDRIEITIKGVGGHGGIPQNTRDPIVAAAAVIQGIQTIVSRNTSPIDAGVISIGNIRAGEGTTNNVIPDTLVMLGTVRTYKKEVQSLIVERLKTMVETISKAYGCSGSLNYIYELIPVTNSEKFYEAARDAVLAVGAEPVDPIPSTGGEDFSEYIKTGIPCFFYWLGVRNEEKDCIYPWHSPQFKADEHCIVTGAGVYAMSVFKAIETLQK